MTIVALALALMASLETSRRLPFYAAARLYIAYLGLSVGVFLLFANEALSLGRIYYLPASLLGAGSGSVGLIYSVAILVAWTATIGVVGDRTFSLRQAVQQTDLRPLMRALPFAALPLWIGMLFHATELSWSDAWLTNSYSVLNSAIGMRLDSLPATFFHHGMPLVLLISGAALTMGFFNRSTITITTYGIVFAYCLIYQIGSHSRWGGLPFIVVALAGLMLSRRKFLPALVMALGALLYLNAIVGRASQAHGISTIFTTLGGIDAQKLRDASLLALYTMVEGIFTIARAASVPGEHQELYKLLSFSPLPSALDGFSAVRAGGEIRVAWQIPMDAWSESQRFGLAYFLLWCGTLFLVIRQSARLAVRRHDLLAIGSALLLTVFMIFAHGYPVRNVYRFILAIGVLQAFILVRWPRNGVGSGVPRKLRA